MSEKKITPQICVISPNGPPKASLIAAKVPGDSAKRNDFLLEASGSTIDLLRLLSETIAVLLLQLRGPRNLVQSSIRAAVSVGFELAEKQEKNHDRKTD